MNNMHRKIDRFILFLLLPLLSACSVHYDRQGKIDIQTDIAGILGNDVGHFTLADNSTGTLRELNGKYSLKFGNLFVERSIEGVNWARITHQYHIDGHTLLLVNVATASCPTQYRLFDLQKLDSREWNFNNDCGVSPQITQADDRLIIDFPRNKQARRYMWQHGEVYKSQVAVNAGTASKNKSDSAAGISSSPQQSRSQKSTTTAARSRRHQAGAAASSVPEKVAQPALDNRIPDEVYEPTQTRQTSLDVKP